MEAKIYACSTCSHGIDASPYFLCTLARGECDYKLANPCINCKSFWSAGRNCSCQECCEKLKKYKENIKEESVKG
jgi:hypothetical protein